MKKRIILLTLSVSLAGLLLFAVISAVTVHNGLIEDSRGYLSVYMLSYEKNPDKFAPDANGAKLLSEETGGARVTFISLDGAVLADSQAQNLSENHAARKEVAAALTSAGEGFAWRTSDSVGVDLVYYCKRFDAQNLLVRIAVPVDGVLGVLSSQLPLLLVFVVLDAGLCVGLSFLLVRFVLKPVETFAERARGSAEARLRAPYPELIRVASVVNDLKADGARKVERIRLDAEREKSVLDSMDSGLVLLDDEMKPARINKKAAELFSYGGSGYVTPLMQDREIRAAIEEKRGLAMKRTYGAGEYLVKVSPSQAGVIVLIADVTAAERAQRSKDEFIANVTHEMNTPLTSIGGFGELLASGGVKPEGVRHTGEVILNESRRLQGLVKSILSYSAMESEDAPISDVDLSQAVKSCAALLTPQAQQKKVTISLCAEDGVTVRSTPARIAELLRNLMSNAIRYNREGGYVRVCVDRQDERVRLTVSDNGIGIEKENLDKIFDRFYTVDASHSGKNGGYGLGLAIVKKMARLSGWEITVASAPREGTKFTVLF